MGYSHKTVFLVGGPTASGKSAFAQDLAEKVDGTVINADSMQVYRDLPILTACPSGDDINGISYRLYGVLDADEKCSAARWVRMATDVIEESFKVGKIPVLVGGTGLYFKALTEGLAPVPEVDPSIVERARLQREKVGAGAFHQELQQRDPELALKLVPGDTQRVLRAWSVHEATGIPLSVWQKKKPMPPDWDFRWIVLEPPRDVLYAACNTRFLQMIKSGAIEELRAFLSRGLPLDIPLMKALGVRELTAYLQGEMPLDEAVNKAQISTRHYAKRQQTWFRHQVVGKGLCSHIIPDVYRSGSPHILSALGE